MDRSKIKDIKPALFHGFAGAFITALAAIMVAKFSKYNQVIYITVAGETYTITKEDYENLIEENTELEDKIDNMKIKIDSLQDENTKQKDTIDSLQSEIDSLKKENEELHNICDKNNPDGDNNSENESTEEIGVGLLNLIPYIGDDMEYYARHVTDNMGHDHYNVYNVFNSVVGDFADRVDNTYDIEKSYSRLEATVFVTYDERNYKNRGEIIIFGDERELYRFSGDEEIGIKPFDFSVDVEGVEDLRIVVQEYGNGSGGSRGLIALDNILLYP